MNHSKNSSVDERCQPQRTAFRSSYFTNYLLCVVQPTPYWYARFWPGRLLHQKSFCLLFSSVCRFYAVTLPTLDKGRVEKAQDSAAAIPPLDAVVIYSAFCLAAHPINQSFVSNERKLQKQKNTAKSDPKQKRVERSAFS